MSAGERSQGPRGRESVIASIGITTNRLQSHDTKQLNQSAADAALDEVIERVHDQLVMDALVLRLANELEWNDAHCELIKQHHSVRFHTRRPREQSGLKRRITTVEIKRRDNFNINRDQPGATEAEKELEQEKSAEVERKMEAEEVNRNGERCFKRSDLVVRPSVAESRFVFFNYPVMISNTRKQGSLQPVW